jgi:hypothetical protein
MNQQDPVAAEAVNELTSVVSEMSVSEMSVSEMSVSEMSVSEMSVSEMSVSEMSVSEVAEQEPMDGAVEAESTTTETEADPAP